VGNWAAIVVVGNHRGEIVLATDPEKALPRYDKLPENVRNRERNILSIQPYRDRGKKQEWFSQQPSYGRPWKCEKNNHVVFIVYRKNSLVPRSESAREG
jgi:hypothetical protein